MLNWTSRTAVYVVVLLLAAVILNACGGEDDETIVEPPPGAPAIDTFAATPETIEAGETSTLSWSLSGEAATSVTIDNGVGEVTGTTSAEVTPTETTTYTLSATNSAGSNTRSVTVNVEMNDTPPPPSECDVANNNSFATACALPLDTPTQEEIETDGDEDYYSVIVDQSGVLLLNLDPAPPEVRMNVTLYDANQNRLDRTGFGDAGQARFLEQSVDAGTYFVVLNGSGSSEAQYTLEANFDTTDPNENNNTFSQATELTLTDNTVQTTGTIRAAGDEDYFEVTVSEPGVLVMNLDPVPATVRMNIELYDANQNRLDRTGFGNAGQARLLEQLVDAGTYYIGLSGGFGDSDAAEYTFTLDFDTADNNEINNTFSQAAELTLTDGSATTTGTIRSVRDEDYFVLTLAEGGVLRVNLDPVPATVGVRVDLYDAAQTLLERTPRGNPGQPRSLEYAIESGGTYYIGLFGGFGESSADPYTLEVTLD